MNRIVFITNACDCVRFGFQSVHHNAIDYLIFYNNNKFLFINPDVNEERDFVSIGN